VKLLSLARDLKRRKARERHGLFVAEGIRTVDALLASRLMVRGALCTPDPDPRLQQLRERLADRGIPTQMVSDPEFASAADTESPQGILAIGTIPRSGRDDLPTSGDVLVLDAVQDPGNVGTIIRSAAALGAGVTLALPGTVDLWNAKVVRSAMGALFSHPVVSLSWESLHDWLGRQDIPLWVAAADGTSIAEAVVGRPPRVAVVVANEGAGVSAQVADAAARRVAIPMAPTAESLNVAVATGILLYVLGHHSP
jgi:TrmH family RNA methyltransferase